jgi:DNA modification methylase
MVGLHLGDCLEIMPLIPDKSIDIILTDPPYGISDNIRITRGKNKMKFKGSDINYNFGDWDIFRSWDNLYNFTVKWIDLSISKIKDDGVFITFFDRKKIGHIIDYLENIGFRFRNMIFFCKSNPVPQARKINWQSSVEVGIIMTRGKAHYNYIRGQHKEYWTIPICSGNERTPHPTQKPLKIFSDLVEWWSFDDDTVLDPFMGSGTTGVACKNLNRRFIGIEKDEKYFEIAKRRIENHKPQENLF